MDYVSCSFISVKQYVNGLVCTLSVMFAKASEEVGVILKSIVRLVVVVTLLLSVPTV
jgi:hypothetical protein